MTDKILELISKHANETTPEECCGFVFYNENNKQTDIFPCINIAENKKVNFVINPKQLLEVEKLGKILAVYHSHTLGNEQPSIADKINSQALNLPFIIYSIITKKCAFYIPDNFISPLIGRPFVWGISDCWCVVRDYFKQNLNISLGNDYFRAKIEDVLEYNYFELNLEKEGFYKVDDLKENDIILMKINSKVINHIAVYVGHEQIFHHPGIGKLSCKSFYGSYWRKNTAAIYRHKDLK